MAEKYTAQTQLGVGDIRRCGDDHLSGYEHDFRCCSLIPRSGMTISTMSIEVFGHLRTSIFFLERRSLERGNVHMYRS